MTRRIVTVGPDNKLPQPVLDALEMDAAEGVQGPPGPTGPKGDTGEPGAPGAAGAPGAPGAQGAKGDKGDTGNAGATGAAGAQGIQGVKGDKGDKGDTGDAGAAGAAGTPGAQGIQGVKGDKGDTGDAGAPGATGAAGAAGEPGAAGAPGLDGALFGTVPPAGWQIPSPMNFSGAASALTSGRLCLLPLDIASSCSIDAILANVTTAAVAGTFTATVGIYPSDSRGWPDGSAGALRTASVVLTSTGIKISTFASLALAPGRYWLAFLYVQTTAPTTLPQVTATSNVGISSLPKPVTVAPHTAVRGYFVAGQTGMGSLTFTTSNTGASGSNDLPALGVRVAD